MSCFGVPDLAEALAFLGLVAPLGLALAACKPGALKQLEADFHRQFSPDWSLFYRPLPVAWVSPFAVCAGAIPFRGCALRPPAYRRLCPPWPSRVLGLGLLAGLNLADAVSPISLSCLPNSSHALLAAVLLGAIVQGALMCSEALKRRSRRRTREYAGLIAARDEAMGARKRSHSLANMSHELRTP